MAEEEGKRRGCAVIALFTLHFQAPGFYQKQGYEVAATLETPPPGATRFLMRKQTLGVEAWDQFAAGLDLIVDPAKSSPTG